MDSDGDDYCDHLVVIDKSVASDFVVGTYGTPQRKNQKYRRFTVNLSLTFQTYLKNTSMLEAGDLALIKLQRWKIMTLWRGLAFYIIQKKVDLIFL